MSYHYARLLDPKDWPVLGYPEGSICIVMVYETGRVVDDTETRQFIEDHEVRYSRIAHRTPPVYFGHVFTAKGEPLGLALLTLETAHPEIGQLWDSIEQAVNPQIALENIEYHVNVGLGMPVPTAEDDQSNEYRPSKLLVTITVLLVVISLIASATAIYIAYRGL